MNEMEEKIMSQQLKTIEKLETDLFNCKAENRELVRQVQSLEAQLEQMEREQENRL